MQHRIVTGVAIGIVIGVFAAISPGKPGFAATPDPGHRPLVVTCSDAAAEASASASSRSRSTASLTSRYQR